MTLDEMVTMVQQQAREIARREEHQPLVMLLKGDDVIPVFMRGDLPRNVLPRVLAGEQPEAYVSIMEARSSYRRAAYEGEISDNPENPELLVMVACERGGTARLWTANIRPSDNPGEREVGLWEEAPAGMSGDLIIENW